MDKYRIYYKCIKKPDKHSELMGFDFQKIYVGRSFNGLFEIAPAWGNGIPTRVVDRSIFNQYFEIVNH